MGFGFPVPQNAKKNPVERFTFYESCNVQEILTSEYEMVIPKNNFEYSSFLIFSSV